MNRRLAWRLWALSLAVCPLAILVLGFVYERHTDLSPDEAIPWPARLVERLVRVQVVVSATASAMAWLLARKWKPRFIAVATAAASVPVTWFFGWGAWMATTGIYL